MKLKTQTKINIIHRAIELPELSKSMISWSMRNPATMDKRAAKVALLFWIAKLDEESKCTLIEVISFPTPPAMNSKMLSMLKTEYRSMLRDTGVEVRFMFYNINWEGNSEWRLFFEMPLEEFVCL